MRTLVHDAVERLRERELLSAVAGVGQVVFDGADCVVVEVRITAPASTLRRVADALEGIPHECVLVPAPGSTTDGLTVTKDGGTWRIGTQAEVAWINADTSRGSTLTAAIPPLFDAYATVLVSDDDGRRADAALVTLLAAHSHAPWWLGYLDTGAHDVVFHDVPKVVVYCGWTYVLVEAGPAQAATWRWADPWYSPLPDLIFPADRTWLVSKLWDDDWRCLGGPAALIDAVLADPALDARRVGVDEDATPPGCTAI